MSSDPARPGTVLYLLPQDATDPPPSIPFADSWSKYTGTYVFTSTALQASAEQAFANAVWAFVADPRNQGTRFGWFDPPGASGLVSGPAVAVYQPKQGAWATSFPVRFPFRNVALEVAGRTAITVDTTAQSFGFTQSGEAIGLSAGFGASSAGTVGASVTLPLAGPLAGCLQFALTLTMDDLDLLDVGLRWFYAIPPDSSSPDAPAVDFALGSLRCPFLATAPVLYPNLDPLAPLDGARTFFAFNPADAGADQKAPVAAAGSRFNATMGTPFSLQPLAGAAIGSQPAAPTSFAALVFAANRQSSSATARDPLYLTPAGDFQLVTTRTGTVDLMCGLSGVEYLQLAPAGTATTLSFFAGNDSFAHGYYPGEPAGWTSLTPADAPTTSFAAATASGPGVGYFAQPDQSVLYNYGDLSGSGTDPITPLAAVPVQAATITQAPKAAPVFPLLPYAGTGGQDPEPYSQLESQVVSPARRAAIAKGAKLDARFVATDLMGGAEVTSSLSTTPQGLLASYVPGAQTWDQVVLAQMPATNQLMLEKVTGNLLSAFQSNKMFLVATDPAAMAPFLNPQFDLQPQHNQIAIGPTPSTAWFFDLATANWDQYRTVFIIKFSDLSIEKLAGNTANWAFADKFNADPGEVSDRILRAIDEARDGGADFATFLGAMTDPNWNGIIALNVKAPLTELPSELAGLAAGINPAKFFAHHVGIAASKIQVPKTPGELAIQDSSIFALIHYSAPPPPPGDGDYAFEVVSLKALFLNSAVASFSSLLDLEINKLFGEPATLQPASGSNIVEFFGVYQRHAGVDGSVQGSYVFQTKTGVSSTFAITSGVLDSVVLSKGQFVTITADKTATFTDSKFLFWGQIDFKELPFDLFSFGSESGATPAGLSVGNLAIEMTFDPQATPIAPVFGFDASQLSLDLATSTVRDKSLFKHFPLTLASFKQGDQGASPTDLGYMGLGTPLALSSLEYPWFALDFDLNLGSAGALAAEAGFVASLTAAWSPGSPSGYKVFSGLKLPGSSGSKRQITIEGLFNITFKSLEILVPSPGTYVLVLYGIGFKFLSLTFPPGGQVNFSLFGDPTKGATSSSLGWYGAYAKDQAQGGGKKQQALAAMQRPALPAGEDGEA